MIKLFQKLYYTLLYKILKPEKNIKNWDLLCVYNSDPFSEKLQILKSRLENFGLLSSEEKIGIIVRRYCELNKQDADYVKNLLIKL